MCLKLCKIIVFLCPLRFLGEGLKSQVSDDGPDGQDGEDTFSSFDFSDVSSVYLVLNSTGQRRPIDQHSPPTKGASQSEFSDI